MNFHLQFSFQALPGKINYNHKMLFIGSCFAESIGETMQRYKFNADINPHGVLYNPVSIAVALRRYIQNKKFQEEELFFANECWNSWEHHSRYSNTDKQICLSEINNSISAAHETVKNAEWIFITFGSAFIYKKKGSSDVVGNCHKFPQKEFSKLLLNTNEIAENYKLLIQELRAINKNLKIIFTISPVRYVRDGVVENNLSKARLIDAVHQLADENNNVFYFPAYELIIDDLRDYRFYKSDLVHPNEQAIEYVFEKLIQFSFSEETKKLFERLKAVITAKEHKPFNVETDSFKKFRNTYSEHCKELQKEFPFLELNEELNYFSS
ncbi:MAG: GSCFA domain-containing protein [Bacteroidia bacterium]